MPKTGKKQDAVLTIRLYRAELDSIEHAANALDKPVSAFVRETVLLRAETVKEPVTFSNPLPDAVQDVSQENIGVESIRMSVSNLKRSPVSKKERKRKVFPTRSSTRKEKESGEDDGLTDERLRVVSRKTGHELACPCFQCVSLLTLMAPKKRK